MSSVFLMCQQQRLSPVVRMKSTSFDAAGPHHDGWLGYCAAGSTGHGTNGLEASVSEAERIGERLRTIRRQKRLSLQEVEANSGKEFKASVLGAYERGERVISVPRLMRLSALYGVPPEQLLPRDEIDLRERRMYPLHGFCLDLQALRSVEGPEINVMLKFLDRVALARQDFNGRVMTIRTDDMQTMAWMLDTTPEDLDSRLQTMGVIVTA